jgi:hypothetical protein
VCVLNRAAGLPNSPLICSYPVLKDLTDKGSEEWIHLTQDKEQRRPLVNGVMSVGFLKMREF